MRGSDLTQPDLGRGGGGILALSARQDPVWVLAFVEEHRVRMAPLSIREALKHLKG
ncbi:DNA alkylation repair protein [Lautropia mirabilis]|uniref:DNA alkylation repair protein n=1 Tax=Lautropia mirabilis TaxID=47671 RepID=UPI0028EA2DA4|nr:DNA alkylation repair protein [Lautropia mirabilis]